METIKTILILLLPIVGLAQDSIYEGYITSFESDTVFDSAELGLLPPPPEDEYYWRWKIRQEELRQKGRFEITAEMCIKYLAECHNDSVIGKIHMDVYNTCGNQCLIHDHYTVKWLYRKPTFEDFLGWLQDQY